MYDAMSEDGFKASSPMLISLLNIATTIGAFEKALAIFEDIAKHTNLNIKYIHISKFHQITSINNACKAVISEEWTDEGAMS